MNFKEWKASLNYNEKYHYRHKARKIQKLLIYNSNPDATVIHHLRDTEEQRIYNDAHYELWGFEINENGKEIFEYGKYVIFVTKEEHSKIHRCSNETRQKLSLASSGENNTMYGKHHSEHTKELIRIKNIGKKHSIESIEKMRLSHIGHTVSEETKKKISNSISGENNPMYGKHLSDDAKLNLSIKNSGKNNPMYGKHLSDDAKKKLSNSVSKTWEIIKQQYVDYKNTGGELPWKDFLKNRHKLID